MSIPHCQASQIHGVIKRIIKKNVVLMKDMNMVHITVKYVGMNTLHYQTSQIHGAIKRITKKSVSLMKGRNEVHTTVKYVDMNILHCQASQIRGVIKRITKKNVNLWRANCLNVKNVTKISRMQNGENFLFCIFRVFIAISVIVF